MWQALHRGKSPTAWVGPRARFTASTTGSRDAHEGWLRTDSRLAPRNLRQPPLADLRVTAATRFAGELNWPGSDGNTRSGSLHRDGAHVIWPRLERVERPIGGHAHAWPRIHAVRLLEKQGDIELSHRPAEAQPHRLQVCLLACPVLEARAPPVRAG